ncbi:MAG: hypothetical protein LBC80_07750 [Treponema sp.]|jgi:tetratricopeptide (TPR) repeat protein|nr:hypothetical protein [Treponema sp.]
MKNCCLIVLVLFTFGSFQLSAFDFSIRPKGFVSIPMGKGSISPDGNDRYSMGGGGDVGLEIDLSTIWSNPLGLGYTLGIEGGMLINPLKLPGADDINTSFYSFGGSLGLYFFPLSRIFTRIDGSIGFYQAAMESGNSSSDLYLRSGGEIGFRFTPAFLLAANGGWRQFHKNNGLLNSGLYTGLTAQVTFQSGRGSNEGIGATLNQPSPLFPAFMQLYQNNPIGTVTIRNNENAEIRDVRLYFRASGFTASEYFCGRVSVVPRGRRAELPLLADFSPEILQFTDSGRILGEVVIRYRFLGQEREVVRAVTVATHNRNRVTEDISALAAFISPTAPETLDFARFIAGMERANRRTGHNQNLHYAMWLFEGLRASNIRLGETYTDDTEAQFPAETLSFRTGSSRDLALLFASALEGVGINSAFFQTEDELLVAVSLNIRQSAAETLFNGDARIIIINDNVWIPLSMSAFNEGFTAAWNSAIAALNTIFAADTFVNFITVEDAWAMYPPAPLPQLGRGVIHTDYEPARREVNRAIQAYIDQELTPLIRQVQTQANAAPTGVLFNRLGILQARAGNIAAAKTAYERAAQLGSVPAMTNRGNLALSEQDFTAAERWFRQALAREPGNPTALRGLDRVEGSR